MRPIGVVILLMTAVLCGCATTAPENSMRRALYLDAHPALPAAMRAGVQGGHPVVGMSREMVVAALGRPQRIAEAASPGSLYECWVYGDTRYDPVITYLYFEGDVLAGFTQKEAPELAIAQARLGHDRAARGPVRQETATAGAK